MISLHLTQSIESAIRSADFLIDTLPDDLEVKLELFTLFDKFAKPNAIFITTGSLPIDDLAAITFCPDRCLAVHLTTTPYATRATFELIPATQTSSPHARKMHQSLPPLTLFPRDIEVFAFGVEFQILTEGYTAWLFPKSAQVTVNIGVCEVTILKSVQAAEKTGLRGIQLFALVSFLLAIW